MAKKKRRRKSTSIKKLRKTIITIIVILSALFGGSKIYDFDLFTTDSSSQKTVFKPSDRLRGKIIRISDGDTVVLLDSLNSKHKIRLDGIDCPETGQDYGTKATNFTKELCMGKNVVIDVTGTDLYQRILGVVWIDTVNLNKELLRNGLAWRYKYNKSAEYLALEQHARMRRLNIWSAKNPVAPWDYRKSK